MGIDATRTNNAITHIKEVENKISETMNELNKHYSQNRCKMPSDIKKKRIDMGKAIAHLRRAKFYLIQTLVTQ